MIAIILKYNTGEVDIVKLNKNQRVSDLKYNLKDIHWLEVKESEIKINFKL